MNGMAAREHERALALMVQAALLRVRLSYDDALQEARQQLVRETVARLTDPRPAPP